MVPSIGPTLADHASDEKSQNWWFASPKRIATGDTTALLVLQNLGHSISDQTVGNILRRFGIAPAPKRSQHMTGKTFIRRHMAVMTGIDFFTVEVLTWRGLVTYYVLLLLQLETRRVTLAGMTNHPTEEWIVQIARRATDDIDGPLKSMRYLLHDRDSKFCAAFQETLRFGGVQPLILPARSPNLNAFAERWVRSIKSECRSKLILFGEASLRRATTEFIDHYHLERPHQGNGNQLLFPAPSPKSSRLQSRVKSRERLGGLLNSMNVPREYFDLTGTAPRVHA